MMFTLSLLFAVTTTFAVMLFAWCWLCFKAGLWMFNVMFRRSPRPRDIRMAAPELASVYAAAYPGPAPEPVRPSPAPLMKRPGSCSTRRCHHGGFGVVMTVLGVALVVFAFRSFSQHRGTSRITVHTAKNHKLAAKVQAAKEKALALLAQDIVLVGEGGNDDSIAHRGNGSWEVEGSGSTVSDAEQQALEKVYGSVATYLHSRFPSLQWTPSTDFIREKLVKNLAKDETRDVPDLGRVERVHLTVQVTPDDQKLILEKDRAYRVEHRALWLGQMLAAALVVLATIAGYVRLDEASKGYYSGWLRLAGTAVVATAAVSLWYFA